MLGGLLSSISAWVLAHQVATRHLIPAAKQGLYHPAEDAIFSALAKDGNDISVYWGAYESGKTTAVRNAGLRLQQMDRLCVLLEGYDLTFPKDFARTLRMRIGVPNDRASLSAHVNRPASVVVDHFDLLVTQADEPLRALRELNTTTLLVVSSWERAIELRDTHGCKLIEPVGQWTEAQLEALFLTLPQSIQDRWAGQEKEELMRLSVLSGAAGYLTFEASAHDAFRIFQSNMCRRSARRAEIIAAEWCNGLRAVNGEVGACSVGRFPDRDGVFHWD
jgi:hypothetical protein